MINRIFSSEVLGFANSICLLTATLLGALVNYIIGVLVTKYDGENNPDVIGYVMGSFVSVLSAACGPFFIIASYYYVPYIKSARRKEI